MLMQIFNNEHLYSPYYTSAFAYYKLETFFRKGNIDTSYRKVKFHILMLFRILFGKDDLPPFNSKRIDKYCEDLLVILNNDDKAIKAFQKCIDVIDKSDFDKTDKQDVKLVSKTRILMDFTNK